MKKYLLSALAGAFAIGLASQPANAQDIYAFGYSGYTPGQQVLVLTLSAGGTVTLDTNGFQGWFSNLSGNTAGPGDNTNYIVGQLGSGNYYNNFFVFDIRNLSQVESAVLSLYSHTITDSLTYNMYDVSTSASTLYNGSSPDLAVFNDLGSGTLYGSGLVNAGLSGTQLNFALNAAAIAALNSTINSTQQYFAIGGSVSMTSGVPEPATWAMMLIGFAGLGFAARRRRAA